jgi:transposase-like protein
MDDAYWQVHGRADHQNPEGTRCRDVASDLCRKHGISDATFYKWRSRYGGMEISDARKLKATAKLDLAVVLA